MPKRNRAFTDTVWQHYRSAGRHTLPWRQTKHPYHILVSEVMLQQTQAARVIPKYKAFLKEFPSTKALAHAPLKDVLTLWQGLGYNRRAKSLQQAAQYVTEACRGRWPNTYEGLLALPGVGPYTAGAVLAFAYNEAVPLIETNVRTVYLHHYFKDKTDVSDADILALVEETLTTDNPREWYYALMDYGAHLKQTIGNQNSRSKAHVVQSPFQGSDRQIRGAIVRLLTDHQRLTRARLHSLLTQLDELRIDVQLERLLEEGMVEKVGASYQLPQ